MTPSTVEVLAKFVLDPLGALDLAFSQSPATDGSLYCWVGYRGTDGQEHGQFKPLQRADLAGRFYTVVLRHDTIGIIYNDKVYDASTRTVRNKKLGDLL